MPCFLAFPLFIFLLCTSFSSYAYAAAPRAFYAYLCCTRARALPHYRVHAFAACLSATYCRDARSAVSRFVRLLRLCLPLRLLPACIWRSFCALPAHFLVGFTCTTAAACRHFRVALPFIFAFIFRAHTRTHCCGSPPHACCCWDTAWFTACVPPTIAFGWFWFIHRRRLCCICGVACTYFVTVGVHLATPLRASSSCAPATPGSIPFRHHHRHTLAVLTGVPVRVRLVCWALHCTTTYAYAVRLLGRIGRTRTLPLPRFPRATTPHGNAVRAPFAARACTTRA